MTDRSDSELPADQAPTGKKPEKQELRARYVEGTYGRAGLQTGRHAEDEEGQYIQGDYGADSTVDPVRKAGTGTRSNKPMTENPHGGHDASQARESSRGADAQADESRSGADVGEAVDIAEAGTKAQGDHSHSERAKTGEAPVEQVFNDPAMTEGQRIVTGSAKTTGAAPPGPSPAEAGSGGAQSGVGPRESDRLAAGEPPAAGKPFDTGTKEE